MPALRPLTARFLPPAAVIAMIVGGSGAALAAERNEKGTMLVVPADQAKLGTVYYALPGRDAQVTFTSDAPLEHIKASSNKVAGYAVVKDSAAGPSIVAAEFRLPVDSFDTGIPMRNDHLRSDRWLDSKTYPDVVFTMSGVKDAKIDKEGEGFKTWSGTLVGKMTIKGATKDMEIPAKITMRPESKESMARAPGDLLAIRCAYNVKLADFGVAKDDPALKSGKVSDEIALETFMMMSTVSPDEAMERMKKAAEARGQGGGGQGAGQGAKPAGDAKPAPAPGGEAKPAPAPSKP